MNKTYRFSVDGKIIPSKDFKSTDEAIAGAEEWLKENQDIKEAEIVEIKSASFGIVVINKDYKKTK